MSHIIIIENFSSFNRLIRVTSWVKRYVNNLKANAFNKTDFENRQFLTADELRVRRKPESFGKYEQI